MKEHPLGLQHLRLALLAGGTLLAACGSEPRPPVDPLLQGSYAAVYDPPLPVNPAGGCDRSIPHAVLSVNDLGGFDLSVNTIEDCGAPEPITFGEVLILGSYTREGSLLSFTPDEASAPLFTGTIEGEFVRLILPPATGVSGSEVELVVGPREPF
jgi:hypothetical protein